VQWGISAFFSFSVFSWRGSPHRAQAVAPVAPRAPLPVLHWGDAASQSGSAIGTDSNGDVYVTGLNAGSIDFGLGTTVGGAFLLKLAR